MRGARKDLNLTDWKPPTDSVNLSYREWLKLALEHGSGDGEHWYFRVGDANNKVGTSSLERDWLRQWWMLLRAREARNARGAWHVFLAAPLASRWREEVDELGVDGLGVDGGWKPCQMVSDESCRGCESGEERLLGSSAVSEWAGVCNRGLQRRRVRSRIS